MKAKIIADSTHPQTLDRLITFELEFPRIILPQVLTHRQFSRNTQSSRAVPVQAMIAQIKSNHYTPERFRANQSGMQPGQALADDDNSLALESYQAAMNHAIDAAFRLSACGVHKQWCNRLLEPFAMVKMVLTSSVRQGLKNFFSLRCSDSAQDEINELANLMRLLVNTSRSKHLSIGEWHLPYCDSVDGQERYHSAGRCAEVSYRKESTGNQARLLADRLISMRHLSPFEHQAQVLDVASSHADASLQLALCGNFPTGWKQYRKQLEEYNHE